MLNCVGRRQICRDSDEGGSTVDINIRVEGQHGSLSDLEWENVPPFAVVTGVNGSGKTQLLEAIAQQYQALGMGTPAGPHRRSDAQCRIDGDSFEVGEVFHSYGEWAQFGTVPATQDELERYLRVMHQGNVTHYRALEGVPGRVEYAPILHEIAAQAGISVEEASRLSEVEFTSHLTPGMFWAHAAGLGPLGTQNIAHLFLAYLLMKRDAKGRNVSEEEIRRRYGEPPWVLLNKILATSGLPFRVDEPEAVRPTALLSPNQVTIVLRDTQRGNQVVPIHGLSSGEKVIMSTVLWRYSETLSARHHRLLLLDEPDAHLHPSLTRSFLEVIQKVFVEERGVRVIMTTHSPSTVALVPEESLFEMQRVTPRIKPATGKARVITLLTDGFVTVQEATQTVMLEGSDDPAFYQLLWDLLTMRTHSFSGPLEPYPNLAFVYGQGNKSVSGIVPQIRGSGLTNFHGIIDRDTGNSPSDGVRVLGRNGMENYLFDPLNVACSLYLWCEAPAVSGIDLPRGQGHSIRDLPEKRLQSIADLILDQVKNSPATDLGSGDAATEQVVYANGRTLRYPRWFLYGDDHKEIADGFWKVFGRKRLNYNSLSRSYGTLNMVPQDLLDLLREIQALGSP